MPEQAEGDKKPLAPGDAGKPTVDSSLKAPANPPDTGQELKGLQERIKVLETKQGDLSLENATLKATINDQKVMGSETGNEEITEDIDISDSQIESITKDGETNPAILKDRIKGVVTQTLGQAQKQQQVIQRKQTKAQAEYRKFTDDIFVQKPHLREFEEQIGIFAEAEYRKTGQGFTAILNGVKQFETKFGHLINKEKPKSKPVQSEDLPAGAVGETAPVTTQPEPEPEKVFDMSAGSLIEQRTKSQYKKIHG